MDAISVRGAREHNLKNLNLEIPRNKLVVITGVSGSGKSSLAFDTLFAEGQRRYVESLSSYARQFLQQMEKPDVDSIDGLSPAISIEQKSVSKNPRSTVGTVTEIHDYMRLLYASIGVPHCPTCGQIIRPQTVQQMVDRVMELPEGTRLVLYAPYVRGKKGEYKKQLGQMAREGFLRARIDGEMVELLGEPPNLDKQKKHSIDIVIDRLVVKPGIEKRLADSIETALKVAGGLVVLAPQVEGQPAAEETLSQNYSCSECGTGLTEITPRLFSFNSPYGACPTCSGLGTLMGVDPEKIVPDPERSILAGAVAPWPEGSKSWRLKMVETLSKAMGFSLATPWKKLPAEARQVILQGSGDEELSFSLTGKKSSYSWKGRFEGVIPMLERRYKETDSPTIRAEIEKYMSVHLCPTCDGRRLRPEALAVKVHAKAIDELSRQSVGDLRAWMGVLPLDKRERAIAEKVVTGDPGPSELPRRRGGGLPDARPLVGDALGRREPAHPPGDADRQQADGRALRARRAVDRPPPAGQRAPARHPARHARPRQLGAGGGARRGDDPRRRLGDRPRSGRRRARRRAGGRRDAGRGDPPSPLAHRQVPAGRAARCRCPRAGGEDGASWSSKARGRTT